MADDTLDAALEEESSAPEAADALDQIATMADFGRALSALLDSRDLTIRKAARRAEIANSTLHNWSKGDHLPTGDEQVAALTRVLNLCGVDSPAQLERWRQALGRVRRQPGRKPAGDAPYRGLASFEETDARWFFGREEAADRLAAAMSDDADFHDLPLILVGPSGAGKSSVLRAGLLPRLTRPAVIFEPTSSPLTQLKAALSQVRDDSPVNAERPAIVVDQFESLFTQAQDDGQRRAFIKELCDLADARTAHVAVALRADFYDHAIRYAELAPALQFRQVVLGPMTAEEVSRAIIEPARLARLDVEDGLVQLLLDDLSPGTQGSADGGAYEPGALPLLSHAMLATWENSRGNTLTVADYLASGRIRDAVQATAEAAYERLTEAEQALARRLFLRLVHVADDAPPTRAVVPLTELRDWEDDGGAEAVLSVFVGERMITVDAEAAHITHDALITAWPRLRGWIDEGQAGLITRRRITEAARAWEDASRDDTWLWRGGQLAIATEWAADNKAALTKLASEFVAACARAERARQLADRRRTRGLQALVAALTAFVVAIALIAVYAFRERHDAVVADNNAVSRQLAVEAGQLRGTDPAIAAQLSVAAYQVARTPQATAALLESSGAPAGARIVDSDGIVQWVAINPARTLMAAAGADGTLKLWNVTNPGRPVLVDTLVRPDSNHPLYAATFSPDGTVLAAAGAGEVVKLWDMTDPARPAPLPSLAGPTSTVYSVAFSPDGRVIAAGSADDNAWLWYGSDPDHPSATGHSLTGAAAAVNSVAFGLGGTLLAAGSADDKVRLYDVATPGTPSLAATLSGPADIVSGVAFSGSGELAATSHDAKVWLWKVTPATSSGTPGANAAGTAKPGKGKKAAKHAGASVTAVADGTLSGAANWTNAVSFGPDGRMVAAGTSDGSVLVWNVRSRALAARVPAPQPVTSVAWDGANRVAASDADGTATIWTLPAPTLLAGNKSAMVAYRPDGKAIAVGGTSVQLWNASRHTLIATRQQADGATVNALSFSPDGTLLAAAYSDGTARVLDGGTLAPISAAFTASAKGFAETLAFSPDGKTLATGGDDGSVRLWSVTDPSHPAQLARVKDTGTQVYTVAFAPNGATLAAASTDDYTNLWNVANPMSPQRYPARLGGLNSYAIGLAFTPDSKLLAVGGADQTVHLWDVANPGHAVPVGTPLTGPSGYVWAAAVSPDGKMLAVGVTDGSVWLWNIADPAHPALVATLTGPADHVYSVAYNPAGTQLTATSYDGTVFTWDTSPAAARSQACASIGQPLTAAEWAKYAPGAPYRTPCS